MTIKKQIFLLISLIAAIPILSFVFFISHQYFFSKSHYLIKGTSAIDKFEHQSLSSKEKEDLYKTLRLLPVYVESCVVSADNKVIFTSIPEMPLNTEYSQSFIWQLVRSTSQNYFYQFTTINLTTTKVTLITRTSRKNSTIFRPNSIVIPVLIMLTLLVITCVVFIITLSKTIFNSIIQIENTTSQIAEGDLSNSIITNKEKAKSNEITTILLSLDKMRLTLLEEQNRRNKFIMGISHDLRTPVAIIKGYSEAISDGIISEKKDLTEVMNLIKNKSSQLEDMINTLINYAKLNDYELRENLIPASITNIIKNFAKDSEIMANVFKRTIITNINISDDIVIPLNEQLVLRALQNLFSNALRYTKDYDVIEINSYTNEFFVFIEIKDSGIGIAEKDLKYIFDMFYRGTNSRHEEGLGIGLAVVNNIIKTHGWNIYVKSEKDKYTCFTIEIPYNK